MQAPHDQLCGSPRLQLHRGGFQGQSRASNILSCCSLPGPAGMGFPPPWPGGSVFGLSTSQLTLFFQGILLLRGAWGFF